MGVVRDYTRDLMLGVEGMSVPLWAVYQIRRPTNWLLS